MKKATVAEVEPLVGECNGNIAEIARRLRVSRGTIHNRIADSPTLQAALDDARETYVDAVESALYANALGGNVAAQIFVMKAHPAAKRRGWSERHELGGPDGGPVQIEHHRLQDVTDDELRRNLADLSRAAALLAAGSGEAARDDAGNAEGDDSAG